MFPPFFLRVFLKIDIPHRQYGVIDFTITWLTHKRLEFLLEHGRPLRGKLTRGFLLNLSGNSGQVSMAFIVEMRRLLRLGEVGEMSLVKRVFLVGFEQRVGLVFIGEVDAEHLGVGFVFEFED